jgi:uncharacterized repeat protein (TIGR03803 family)
MLQKRVCFTTTAILAVLAMIPALTAWAFAASPSKVLYKFKGGTDGGLPFAGLIFDGVGNLYGTTVEGGGAHLGTVFKLTPNSNGSWTETVLYRFAGGSDGFSPWGGLIFDGAGNLYGTTTQGGGSTACGGGCGTVFKLTPNSDGSWTESVLYRFAGGSDGLFPYAGLVFDGTENLYGTTSGGGVGGGTVFKLTPNSKGSWTESVLHSFSGPDDGSAPHGGLTFDLAGNLYGSTTVGGDGGNGGSGTVFELTPNSDGSWKEHVLHAFTGGKDGATSYASVTFDAAGNLYGTAYSGGAHKNGIVFKVDASHKFSVVHAFTNQEGANPYAGLTFDTAGNLYGTTVNGGTATDGVVFKLELRSSGSWIYCLLHVFGGNPAVNPYGGLVLDKAGKVYGTTSNCANGQKCRGTVFEVTP